MSARHDADGDGTVRPEEYDRQSFGRLDHNGDGMLTEQDFSADRTPAAMREMTGIAAGAMLGWYFQDDDDPTELDAGELERVLYGYDSDEDGRIDQPEFECAAEGQAAFGQEPRGRMGRMLRESEPWQTLRSGVDADQDGTLADDEIFAFFEEQDEDADGVLAFAAAAAPERSESAAAAAAQDGAPEGEWAPDFELPRDAGEGTVRLSAFRGDRPVALIFGSYT